MNNCLKEELKKKAFTMRADLFGIAEVGKASKYIRNNYNKELWGFPRVVSMGVFLPVKIINMLEKGPQQTYSYYYNVVNQKLDELAIMISNFIYKEGYNVLPIPASQQLSNDPYKGIFSHKITAYLAGLGWIGKSSCLINEKVGPRLRLVTVLTDAPLEPDLPVANKCGKCTACMESCVPGAIKGISFKPEQELSDRFDPKLCEEYFNEMKIKHGIGHCGKCLAVCPYFRISI